jgi:transposase
VDRGRPGTKRHQVVDKNGLPLATVLSGANVPDGKMMLKAVDAIPPVRGKPGRPRRRPVKMHGDKSYDDKKLRIGLRKRGIIPRLARRNVESSERLGRYRWVAERAFSWQQNARRLRVRDERRDDIYEAFVHLENALICWGRLNGHFC